MNELVQRAGMGDVKALDELIHILTPRINKIVRKYAWIHGVETEDLKQEAFMAIIEGLGRVDFTIGSSSEFLLKFARWRLLDCLKKILRRKEDEFDDDLNDLEWNEYSIPDLELLQKRLSDVQRQIVQFLIQGYTWREIGQFMGFTAANVAHHLKKIRKLYG